MVTMIWAPGSAQRFICRFSHPPPVPPATASVYRSGLSFSGSAEASTGAPAVRSTHLQLRLLLQNSAIEVNPVHRHLQPLSRRNNVNSKESGLESQFLHDRTGHPGPDNIQRQAPFLLRFINNTIQGSCFTLDTARLEILHQPFLVGHSKVPVQPGRNPAFPESIFVNIHNFSFTNGRYLTF